MSQCVIFPHEGSVAVMYPVMEGVSIHDLAQQAVPEGVPYRIIDTADLPTDHTYRAAWTADFSEPDGHGMNEAEWYQKRFPALNGTEPAS